jgi:RND family efflux transporter MFP subunit
MNNKIKNIAGIFIITIILFSCGAKKENKSIIEIKDKITGKEDTIALIKEEVSELKLELEKLDSNKVNNILVNVKKLAPEKFTSYIKVSGVLEALNDVKIMSEIPGQIRTIHVSEGDRVSKGQLLVSLKTDVTQRGIEEVKTGLELATAIYNKQKELWDQKIGSEVQFLQAKNGKESLEKKLETLEAQLEMAKIKAPFSGIIDAIYQKEGDMSSAPQPVLHILNLKDLKIKADVSETYLSKIKKGDSALVSFPAYQELKPMKIRIHRTSNSIIPDNRSFKVDLRLKNIDDMLKPNIIAEVDLAVFNADSAFVVPSEVIKSNLDKQSFMFITEIKDGLEKAKKVIVKKGISYNNMTVIYKDENIKEGTKVIVKGHNKVSNGSRISLD